MEDFFARIGTEWQIGFHEKLENFYHRLYKCCKTFGTLFLKCSGSGYRKVASSRLSRLEAHLRIFRLSMKGKFDPGLCTFGQKNSKLSAGGPPLVRFLISTVF